jgi:phenylacetate-CoA ligase
MTKIVDIVMSSGTTGKPTRIMYTEKDMKRLAYNEAVSLAACGVTQDDVVLLTCTIDRCFIAGLAYYSGARSLGAAVIRNGISSMASHREIIRQMRPTVIVGVPTLLLKLGLFMRAQNVDPRGVGVTKLICIGEPVRDRDLSLLKIGEYLQATWGAAVYSTYASSETITSFCECTSMQGGHLHPDLAIVEIISDEGAVLPIGEVGEVVVTPLAIEGMPLLRFKTGDVSFLIERPCACGRNSLRLGPILGRKKQMIKCRGTTLYPNAIHSVLDGIGEISEYYLEITSDFDLSDRVRIYVSLRDDSYSPEMIMDRLQAHLRMRPEVVVASEENIRREIYSENSRKLIRFKDRRTS